MTFYVKHKSGRGFLVRLDAEDEYQARSIVAGNAGAAAADYIAWRA